MQPNWYRICIGVSCPTDATLILDNAFMAIEFAIDSPSWKALSRILHCTNPLRFWEGSPVIKKDSLYFKELNVLFVQAVKLCKNCPHLEGDDLCLYHHPDILSKCYHSQ